MRRLWVLALLLVLLCIFGVEVAGGGTRAQKRQKEKQRQKQKERAKRKQSAPRSRVRSGSPFLLQSLSDKWQCFAGDRFARCGMDTLWHQTGNAANGINFQLRSAEEGAYSSLSSASIADSSCLVRKSCDIDSEESMHLALGSCEQPCSSLKWALENEGRSEVAVITFNNTQSCVSFDSAKNRMVLDKCLETKYAKMVQIKMSKTDLLSLNGTTHRLLHSVLQKDGNSVMGHFEGKADVNMRGWDESTLLHAASAAGDVDLVNFLVSKKQADVNVHDRTHVTATMEAAKVGRADIVGFLIEAGADADPVDLSGTSPLMLAAEHGHAAVVELLLEQHSVDVNRQDSKGVHALSKACKEGHYEVVKALVAAGANIDLLTNDGSSALTMALETDKDTTPVIELLLLNDADVNNKNGHPDATVPLSMASYMGKDNVVEMLLNKGALVNYVNAENITALMYAASGGWVKIVRLLLRHGADIDMKHKEGATALFEAVVNGSQPITEILLEAGAEFMVTDNDNVTMLHTAAEAGHTKICEILLEKGIPIDTVASPGTTALMHATYLEREETVRLLLAHKANVDILINASAKYIQDNQAELLKDPSAEPYEHHLSALMIACKMGFLPIAKMLVEAGATVNVKDASNTSALVHACSAGKNSKEILTLLVDHGADPNDEIFDRKTGERRSILLHAIVNNFTDLALSLMSKGSDVSFVDGDGLTVGTHAAFLGNRPVIEEIITRRGDLGAGSHSEGTDPLIAASAEGHLEVVQALLKTERVNLKGKDVDGTNALMAASVRGHKHVANLLIKAGVDVNAQNDEGHTALMFAYNGKNQVEILLEKYRDYMKATTDNSTKLLQDALATHTDLIKMLLRSGADANIQDNLGHLGSDFDSFLVKGDEEEL